MSEILSNMVVEETEESLEDAEQLETVLEPPLGDPSDELIPQDLTPSADLKITQDSEEGVNTDLGMDLTPSALEQVSAPKKLTPYEKVQQNSELSVYVPSLSTQPLSVGEKSDRSVLAASFRRSLIGSSITAAMALGDDTEEESIAFDPIEHVPDYIYELGFGPKYMFMKTKDEADRLTRTIEQEQQDKQTNSENFWRSLPADLFVNLPWVALPGGIVYNEYKAALGIARSAASVASAGLAAGTVEEIALQSLQETRGIDESVMNPLVQVLFGGAIGGAAGGLASRKLNKLFTKEMTEIYADTYNKAPTSNLLESSLNKDAGSAAVRDYAWGHNAENPTLKNLEPGTMLGRIFKTFGGFSVINRGLNSEFAVESGVINAIFDQAYLHNKNFEEFGATAASLEVRFGSDSQQFAKVLIDYKDNFLAQTSVKGGILQQERAAYTKIGDNWETHNEKVLRYILTGEGGDNPSVRRGADLLTKGIFDPLRDRAIAVGLLPENVSSKTAVSYFMRVWNTERIVRYRSDFLENTVLPYAIEINDILAAPGTKTKVALHESEIAKINSSKLKPKEKKAKIDAQTKSFKEDLGEELFTREGKLRTHVDDPLILREQADATIDNIIGQGEDRYKTPTAGLNPSGAKPLKDKVYLIPDVRLIKDKWINTDVVEVANRYAKQMTRVVNQEELARDLGFESFTHMETESFISLKSQKDLKMNKILNDKSISKEAKGDKLEKLEKEFRAATKRMKSTFDIARNTINNSGTNPYDNSFAKYGRMMRQLNYLSLMGWIVPASFADLGKLMFESGPMRLVQSGLVPSLKSLNTKVKNHSELASLGYAIESQTGAFTKSMIDGQGLPQGGNWLSRSLDTMTNKYGNITLHNYWSDRITMMAGDINVSRILEEITNLKTGKNVAEKDLAWLRKIGLDENHFDYIFEQSQKYGGTDKESGGAYYSGLDNWDIITHQDAKSHRAYKDALYASIGNSYLKPNWGTSPLFANNEIGKMLLQFKGFMFNMTNRVFFQGMQRYDDAHMWLGTMFMLGLGSMKYVVRESLRGEELDLSPANLALEAVDGSGVLGVIFEVPNLMRDMHLLPGQSVSKYGATGPLERILGPSSRVPKAAVDLIAPFTTGEAFQEGNELGLQELRTLKKVAPLGTFIPLDVMFRRMTNSGEERQ